ncbi:MAG TPA: preprotein translocase subunit SecG [bacterium]|nr:preprotein translocase subunit SecG [bacterium]
METALYVIFIIVCLFIIGLVLIQQGKGAGVGFSMGGASQAMFGGSGGREFFIKLTSGLAVVFMVICIVLAKMAVTDAGSYHGAMAGAATVPAAPTLPGPGGLPLNPANQAQPVAPVPANAQPLQALPAPAAQSAPAPAPAKQ